MPELPEVETIVQTLSQNLKGYKVASFTVLFSGLLRNSREVLEQYRGRVVTGFRRRGKFILIDFDHNFSLLFHLKMTGQLLICHPEEAIDKHTHFILTFEGNNQELRFRDIRKFGFIQCLCPSEASALDSLGPEPLEIHLQGFKDLFRGRKARVKSLLLKQNFIAGIGNIYADEILFEARLHPLTPASLLEEEELKGLWRAVRLVLRRAIRFRGSTIRNFKNADGREGSFQDYHQVYGKESSPCPRCGERIKRLRISGRSSFFCPKCQRKKKMMR